MGYAGRQSVRSEPRIHHYKGTQDQEALEEEEEEQLSRNAWDDFQRAWAMLVGGL